MPDRLHTRGMAFQACPGSHYYPFDPSVSVMNESRYRSAITRAYEGECYGMHLFGLLADRQQDSVIHRRIWKLIQTVERITEQRIRPIAKRLDIDLALLRTQGIQRANQQAAVFSELSAGEIAHWYVPRLPGFLTELKAVAEMAPADDDLAMQQLVRHSRVFGRCIRAMTEGHPEQGLSALEGFLEAGYDHHDCSPPLSSIRDA